MGGDAGTIIVKRLAIIAILLILAGSAHAAPSQGTNRPPTTYGTCMGYQPGIGGDFCVNSGPQSFWQQFTGDVTNERGTPQCSATNTSNCGKLTVKGLQGVPLPTPTDGNTFCYQASTNTFVNCTGGGGTPVSANNIINVMAPPYNAKDDGIGDAGPAIQQAIYDSCNGGHVPAGHVALSCTKAIYLPYPSNCYMHSQPIRIPGSNLEFFGENYSKLCQNYWGPSILQTSWGATNATYTTPLVTGSGQGLISPNGGAIYFYPILFLNGPAYLNENMASQFATNGFSIEGFFKPTVAAGAGGGIIACSKRNYPDTSTVNGLFCLSESTTAVSATVNTTGGLVSLAACPAFVQNTTYEYEISWDKTNYRLFQGTPGGTSTLCGTTASANPPVQGLTEEVLLPGGGRPNLWMQAANNLDNSAGGVLSSWRWSKIPRHTTTYTVPSAQFATDANTVYLTNFETIQDGNVLKGYTGTTGVVYENNSASDIGAGSGDYIHDLDLCGGNSSNSSGLFAGGANNAIWERLNCSHAFIYQIDLDGNDFVSKLSDFKGQGGVIGIIEGPSWNSSIGHNNSTDGGYVGVIRNGGGAEEDHLFIVDRGGLVYGFYAAAEGGLVNQLTFDSETPNSTMIAPIWLKSPGGFVFNNVNIASRNNAPFIVQDGGGIGSIFYGGTFNDFGAVPEIVAYINGAPTASTQFLNASLPAGVPFSNHPEWIQQPGIDPLFHYTVAASTSLILPLVGYSKHLITLNASTSLVLPAGVPQAGPNYLSQSLTAYVCYSGSRTVTDGVTNTTTTITSATAAFVCPAATYPCTVGGDVGRIVTGSADIPAADAILSIQSATSATLTAAATAGHSGQTFTLNNFIPTWTNGPGNALHGALPTSTATGNRCDLYDWDYQDPANVFLHSYTLNLPG